MSLSPTEKESLVTKSGEVDYLRLIKNFNINNSEVCKFESSLQNEMIPVERPTKNWISGSSYTGEWNVFGINGHGIYQFADGVIFEGAFKNNFFDGYGEYRFENGDKMKVLNRKGTAIQRMYIYKDGTRYWDQKDENSKKACKPPDRRFATGKTEGLQPAFNERMAPTQPPIEMGPGEYDCGVGCFNNKTKFISNYGHPEQITRALGPEDADWVEQNCRTAQPLPPLGPCPNLYEEWPCPFEWVKSEIEKLEFELQDNEMLVSPPHSNVRLSSVQSADEKKLEDDLILIFKAESKTSEEEEKDELIPLPNRILDSSSCPCDCDCSSTSSYLSDFDLDDFSSFD